MKKKSRSTGEVGYCKPPEHTRFKKGQSGNPSGRPKGTKNALSVLDKTLREKVVITENGRRRTITKLEAAIKQLVNQAATGDQKALRLLLALKGVVDERPQEDTPANEAQREVDQKIMKGILERFSKTEDNTDDK